MVANMAHTDGRQDIKGGSSATVDRKKERKRELDRISQQRKRKNDRETISKLKAQVKALESQTDDNYVFNLILRQEEDQEKMKRHKERIKLIESLVKADLDDLGKVSNGDYEVSAGMVSACKSPEREINESDPKDPITDLHFRPEFNPDRASAKILAKDVVVRASSHLDAMTWDELTDGVHTMSPDSDKTSLEECMDIEDVSAFDPNLSNETGEIAELPSSSLPPESLPTDWVLQGTSSLDIGRLSGDLDCHRCESMWTICDSAIVQGRGPFLYSSQAVTFNEGDAHVIITAIAEGWAKASKSPYWNAHWEALRQIDQFCHSMCGPVERMSSLYTLIRMFKYQKFPGDPLAAQLPTFLRARPSQLHVPHAPVVDHFIWPGFREHLVFDHKKYHKNSFSNDYGHALRFIWPYELRDTYMKNKMTGLYQFSSDFIERADDLRFYAMKWQFLAKYPEFQGDVPVFDPAPRLMPTAGASNSIFCHFPVAAGVLRESRVEEVDDASRINV